MDRFVRLILIAMVATYAGCGNKQSSSTAEVVNVQTETSAVKQPDERASLSELTLDPSEPLAAGTPQETAEDETSNADAPADEPPGPLERINDRK